MSGAKWNASTPRELWESILPGLPDGTIPDRWLLPGDTPRYWVTRTQFDMRVTEQQVRTVKVPGVDLGAVAGLSPTLTWQSTDPDGDSLWCEVYLGVNSQNLPRAGTTTAASYAAAALQAGATYYWRVVVHDWKSRTTGPVWEFDTP